jgi:hypothetical protein
MLLEQKITLREMRQSGARRLHVFCGDYKCSHSVVIDTDCWPESLRLPDLEAMFVCRPSRRSHVGKNYDFTTTTGIGRRRSDRAAN